MLSTSIGIGAVITGDFELDLFFSLASIKTTAPYLPRRSLVLKVNRYGARRTRKHAAHTLAEAGERVEGSRQGVGLGGRATDSSSRCSVA